MVMEGIKAKLYNCRFFLVSSNADARNAFKGLIDQNELKGFENFNALEHAQKRLEDYLKSQIDVHMVIIDIDGEYYNERLQFFNYIRRFQLTEKTPIIVLNKDWNNKQKKSLDDSECADGEIDSDEDAWFTDSLTKFVNRPLDMNWVVDHMENLLDEAYPDGVWNFQIDKDEKKYEVTVPAVMDKINFCELELLLNEIVSDGIRELVFNFQKVDIMGFQDLRLIFQMTYNAKKMGVNFWSVNVKEQLSKMMEQNGLLDSFNVKTTVKRPVQKAAVKATRPPEAKAKSPANEKYVSININMVKPFIQASINGFNEYINIDMQPQQPRMTDSFTCPPMSSFATVIKLEAPAFCGTIAQIYTKETFVKLCREVALQCKTHDVKVIMAKLRELLEQIFIKAQEKLAIDGIELFEDEKEIKLVHSYESIMKEFTKSTSIVIPINSKLGYISMVINGHSSI